MSKMLTINGFSEYLERLQEMGKDIDAAAEDSLMTTATRVTDEMEKGIARHKDTGKTRKQLRDNPRIQSGGGRYSVKVGFKMPEGLPARYINKGVPTIKKDPFVDRALNKTRLKKERESFFQDIMNH